MRSATQFMTVCVLACLFVPALAIARIGAGDIELGGRLSFSHTGYSVDGDDVLATTALEFQPSIGYFTSDLFEIGGSVFLRYTSFDPDAGESASATVFGIGPDIYFNFNNDGPVVPFIGLSCAIVLFDGEGYGDETGLILPSFSAGIRAQIGDSASFNLGASYAHGINPDGVDEASSNSLGLFAGFSVFP